MLIEISITKLYIIGVVIMFSGIISIFVLYDNVVLRVISLFLGMLGSMWVYKTASIVNSAELEE